MDRCDEVDAPRNEGLLKHRPVGIAAGRAVTLIGKLDDQRKHWGAECPTQALGNRQVARHERCRAQRGRSEALAKRVFINTQVLQFAV